MPGHFPARKWPLASSSSSPSSRLPLSHGPVERVLCEYEVHMSEIRIDALLPAEMATRAEYLGVRKAEMPTLRMFMLAVLAGAFIALGAVFATVVSAGSIPITDANGAAASSESLSDLDAPLEVGWRFS